MNKTKMEDVSHLKLITRVSLHLGNDWFIAWLEIQLPRMIHLTQRLQGLLFPRKNHFVSSRCGYLTARFKILDCCQIPLDYSLMGVFSKNTLINYLMVVIAQDTI